MAANPVDRGEQKSREGWREGDFLYCLGCHLKKKSKQNTTKQFLKRPLETTHFNFCFHLFGRAGLSGQI
jgi:hypothetical protein